MEVENSELKQEQKIELTDALVFGYINEKLGRQISSYEDLIEVKETVIEREKEIDDPEIATAYKFKKETGRGIGDYIMAQRDPSTMSEDDRLRMLIKNNEPEFSDEDVEAEIRSLKKRTAVVDEYDEESKEKADAAKREMKRLLGQANKLILEQNEKYKSPIVDKAQKIEATTREFSESLEKFSDLKFKSGDFEFEIKPSVEHYKTPEKFFSQFEKDGKFNHSEFVEMNEFWKNREKILTSFKEDVIAKYKDEELKQKNNVEQNNAFDRSGSQNGLSASDKAFIQKYGRF